MVRQAPLWACLREAFAFVPRAWAGAWLVLVLFAATLGGLLVPWHMKPFEPVGWLFLLWLAGVAVLKVASYGALFRISIFGSRASAEGLGFGGLQVGRAELRMLGGAALVILFLTIVAVGLLVAVTLIMAAAAGEEGRAVGLARCVVLGVQGIAVLILPALYVRLSLFAPATVGRRRMVSLDALGLAQGSFWTLLIGLVVCLVPTGLIVAAAFWLVQDAPDRAGPASVLITAVMVFVLVPLTAGFLAAVYKHKEYVGQPGG